MGKTLSEAINRATRRAIDESLAEIATAVEGLVAAYPPSPSEETGWLIEHGKSERPLYWTGQWGRWSDNHQEACRFARREDAFKVSLSLGDLPTEHRIVEHMWSEHTEHLTDGGENG